MYMQGRPIHIALCVADIGPTGGTVGLRPITLL